MLPEPREGPGKNPLEPWERRSHSDLQDVMPQPLPLLLPLTVSQGVGGAPACLPFLLLCPRQSSLCGQRCSASVQGCKPSTPSARAFGCHLSLGVDGSRSHSCLSVGLRGRPPRVLCVPGKQRWGQRSSVVGKEQVSPLHFVKLLILGSEGPTSSVPPARVPFPPTRKPPDDTPLLLGGQCHLGCQLLQGVTVFQAQVTDVRRLKLVSLLLQFLFLLLFHLILLLFFRPIQ